MVKVSKGGQEKHKEQASISLSDNCGLLRRELSECNGTRFAARDSYLKGWQSKVKGHYLFANLFYIIPRPMYRCPGCLGAPIIRIIPRKGIASTDALSREERLGSCISFSDPFGRSLTIIDQIELHER